MEIVKFLVERKNFYKIGDWGEGGSYFLIELVDGVKYFKWEGVV